jgi:hypothetical protein
MSQLLTTLPRDRFTPVPGVALVVRRKIIGRCWTFEVGQKLRGERDADGTWTVWPPHDRSAYIIDIPRWYVRLDRQRTAGRKRVASETRHSPNSELDATVAPYKAQSFRLFRLVSL